jgi:hypothetical protein
MSERIKPDQIQWLEKKDNALTYSELDTNFKAVKQNMEDILNIQTTLSSADVFSGDYNDLGNRPTLFDGQYSSLIGKPYIPTQELISEIQSDIFALKVAVTKLGEPIPIPAPTITMIPSIEAVNEVGLIVGEVSNQVITFTITTANTTAQENLNWSISGTNINPADFSSVLLDGETVDISSLSGIITNATLTHTLQITIARDEISEGGNEVFNLTVTISRETPVTETRSVTIIDNSLNSNIKSVSWPGPLGPLTLFEHIRDVGDSVNGWGQDFDLDELKISPAEEAQIISDALNEDYTSLIELGLTYDNVVELINLIVPEVANVMNSAIDATFGSGNTVIFDDGVVIFGSYDSETLELRSSNNRLYIRNESPAFTGVDYTETYNLEDLRASTDILIDGYLENYDWTANGFRTPTPEELTQIKDSSIAFINLILPIAVDIAQAMSTTLDLYGYRKLSAGS